MNISKFLGRGEPTLDDVAQLADSAHEDASLALNISMFALSVAIIAIIIGIVA